MISSSAVPPPLSFIHPELALGVSPKTWRALFTSFGFTAKLPSAPLALARVLWGIALPSPLADALAILILLGTAAGRDALVEAALDIAFPHDGWDDTSPAELAATLLVRRAKGGDLAPLFDRALIRLARGFVERIPYEVVAVSAARVVTTKTLARALSGVVAGPWSDAWITEDDDGNLHIAVLYAEPARAQHAVTSAGPQLEVRRTLRADVLRVDVADGRVRIETARPTFVWPYVAAIGEALFGNTHFYSNRPAFTLKPLQRLSAEGFRGKKLPVLAHSLIALQRDTGDDARFEGRSLDALASFELHAPMTGGYYVRATLRFAVRGADRPVDVFLELPNKVSFSDPRFEPQCRAALDALGIFQPGSLPDDITSLWPCEHADWRFREAVTNGAFEAGIAAGLFTRVKSERVASEALRRLGRSYRAFELPGVTKKRYALGDDASVRAVTVDESSMMVLRWDRDAFMKKVRGELGIAAIARPSHLPPEVLVLGKLEVPSAKLYFVYVAVPPATEEARDALRDAITTAAGAAMVVVAFVPKGRSVGLGRREIELDVAEQLGCASWQGKIGDIAERLGLTDEIEPWRAARADAAIVCVEKTQEVYFHGVHLARLARSGRRLALRLAKAKGAIVGSFELDSFVSTSTVPGTAKRAARVARVVIREAFEAEGKPLPADAKSVFVFESNRGWRMGVKAVVR